MVGTTCHEWPPFRVRWEGTIGVPPRGDHPYPHAVDVVSSRVLEIAFDAFRSDFNTEYFMRERANGRRQVRD